MNTGFLQTKDQELPPNLLPSETESHKPGDFADLPLYKKQISGEESLTPNLSENIPSSDKTSLLFLENYKGDQDDIRDPSFKALSLEEQIPVYDASFKAIFSIEMDSSGPLKDFLKGKKITLVGSPGVSFENNQLKIGLGATKEEIKKVLEETAEKEQISMPEAEKEIERSIETKPEIVSEAPEADWKKLDDLRRQSVREEINQKESGILGINLKWQDYENQKKLLEEKIRKDLTEKAGEDLTEEQKIELEKEIKNVSFEKLVEKENEARLKDERAIRAEGLIDKTKETVKYLLKTKAVNWYLKQNRWTRLSINTVLATFVGYSVGTFAAAGAVGYAGARVVRGAASFAAAGKVNRMLQEKPLLSIDKLNQDEQREMEELKNSDKSLEEKSKKYAEIKEHYDGERRKAALIKLTLTAAAGAGAGAIAGLSEYVVDGFNDSNIPGQTQSDKFMKDQTVEPNLSDNKDAIPVEKPDESIVAKVDSEPSSIPAEKIFDDPEILKHEVVAGDSVWKILAKILDNNDQFKEMTTAQKTYILSFMTNKALKSPEDYGLNNDGSLYIGNKTDFTKLFEDSKEVESIFDKAKNTVVQGSPQEESILANDEKIAEWVKNNPDVELTNDKVSEILSSKPKTEIVKPTELVEPAESVEEAAKTEVLKPESEPETESTPPKIEDADVKEAIAAAVAASAVGAGVITESVLEREKREKMMSEIRDAKDRLQVLEGGRNKDSNLERSMHADSLLVENNNKLKEIIWEAFRGGVNETYGKKGTLGIGKVEGLKTKEWAEIDGFTAKELVQYTEGELERGELPAKLLKVLESPKHQQFIKEMVYLMEKTENIVKPREREKPGEFMLRLIEFNMNKKPQLGDVRNLAKAA